MKSLSNMGSPTSPELDCVCFERDSLGNGRFSSILFPPLRLSIRTMGVDVPDDFAG